LGVAFVIGIQPATVLVNNILYAKNEGITRGEILRRISLAGENSFFQAQNE
jgi:hypothetical protein